MKTLYVSDLDGTLLQSNQAISEFSAKTINQLVEEGMLFSYATARSFVTGSKVTKNITAKIPVIVYNGTFVIDSQTEEILIGNYLDEQAKDVIVDLINHEIYPIVYSFIDHKEYFSFMKNHVSSGMRKFLDTRIGDPRCREVETMDKLLVGNIFYITCIDEKCKLDVMYEKYQKDYHCIYDKDVYSDEQWLEFTHKDVSKAHAIKQLKQLFHCDKVVCFGDGLNDMEMFELSDESYAVANANSLLKEKATEVILSNNEDGVAKKLIELYRQK